MGWLEDETGLQRCRVNYVPLSPLSHLRRAQAVFPEREALVYRARRFSYRRYYDRVTRLASAMASLGVKPGDVVSTVLPNTPAQVEAHFGVPACGAVLNTINMRLDVSTISYILEHAAAKVVLADTQYLPVVEEAAEKLGSNKPTLVEVSDAGFPKSGRHVEYEELLGQASPTFDWVLPEDEWESIALNYTSGTTGRPKGVVYHHRGAYLMTMGTVISWRMTLYPRLLAVVPLFHCNGWNHSWMMPVLGGTVVCCRNVSAKAIYQAIADEHITHFGGAPIVLNLIANAAPEERRDFNHRVEVFTAGAPPPAAILQAVERLNFNVTQVYGLTETYGHITECIWDDDNWGDLSASDRANIKARQGVLFPMMEDVAVFEKDGRTPVRRDGDSLGEIHIRGNSVMKGYYRNSRATKEAFSTGYFASGDIAVQHADGYIQIADRAKDIIISGGENVSSVEVEGILTRHPAVSLSAVVAKPDEKWGEVPCAFVELVDGADAEEQQLMDFCRQHLAGFKVPKFVRFVELPKTATGKIQKFMLRNKARTL